MQNKEIDELFERYNSGTCSEREKEIIDRWYLNWKPEALDLSERELRFDLDQVRSKLVVDKKRAPFYYKFTAAAILLLTIGIAFYFYSANHQKPLMDKVAQKHLILPGRNQAILTLANGKKIILDTIGERKIIDETGIRITKTSKGELVYEVQPIENTKTQDYNTVSTPRGGQYQVLLPDGTKVWLNAASNLRFPVFFGIKERKVELSGEAYFEVSKDAERPFKVNSGQQEITVLGTHFNVNAYQDETFTKTTLLEGSVRVAKSGVSALLKPGQQAINNAGISSIQVRNVDINESIAWKNGLFMFEKESIFSIMNKVSRWYDVDIIYSGDLKGKKYSGTISRFGEVTEVLKTMQLTGTIQFKIEGRRIIVMP